MSFYKILNSYYFETTRIQEILPIYEHNRDVAPKTYVQNLVKIYPSFWSPSRQYNPSQTNIVRYPYKRVSFASLAYRIIIVTGSGMIANITLHISLPFLCKCLQYKLKIRHTFTEVFLESFY